VNGEERGRHRKDPLSGNCKDISSQLPAAARAREPASKTFVQWEKASRKGTREKGEESFG
jgi:hypothetical protein